METMNYARAAEIQMYSGMIRPPLTTSQNVQQSPTLRTTIILLLTIILIILITPLYIIYKPPTHLIRYFQCRWPDVLWHVPTSLKIVGLTIDDGPSRYTDEIAQVLAANGATATFFIIGSYITRRENTLQSLIRGGNELGNHAMNDEPSRSLSDAELAAQVERVDRRLRAAYAAADNVEGPANYFRPGSGFFSTRMRWSLRKLGYRLVLGSIYPHDAQIPLPWVNARHVLSMLRPGGIIVCHDGRSWTVPMLKKVLPQIRRRGYRIVTITELLKETGIM